MKKAALFLFLVMGASCAANPNQDDQSECVASCMNVEPEHPSECAASCVAHDNDATIATAEVNDNCQLTEDPIPIPAGGGSPFYCRVRCACGYFTADSVHGGQSLSGALSAARASCYNTIRARSATCSPITETSNACTANPDPSPPPPT